MVCSSAAPPLLRAKTSVENLFVDHFGTAVGLIDLIDYHDGFLAEREGFLEDETGLGHRSFESIDEQQYAVAHVEHTLHLAAEVGVAPGVSIMLILQSL